MFEDMDNPLARAADVIASGWTRMFGSRNDRLVRDILPIVAKINALEGEFAKLSDEELKGRYSNLLRIAHTREEFILDFINLVPPQAVVSARIVTSPGHLKRIIQALHANLKRYEETHGEIQEAPDPQSQTPVH